MIIEPHTLKMARLLIDTLSGPFEPELFSDEHRQRVLKAIQEKVPLRSETREAPSPTRVLDLMAALEASVKAAKARRPEKMNHQAGRACGRRLTLSHVRSRLPTNSYRPLQLQIAAG